jgi:hypothetical protein
MNDQILEPYRTLEELFRAEQSAFREKNAQKLAALAPQIQKCCKRVADLEKRFPELNVDQVRVAKVLIRRLQRQIGLSRNSWERYQNKLEQERNHLQASKRFVHQAKLEQSSRRPRISHSV